MDVDWKNIADNWQEMLTRAEKLPLEEIRRHARVSIDNRHRCRSCFTCACATTMGWLKWAD